MRLARIGRSSLTFETAIVVGDEAEPARERRGGLGARRSGDHALGALPNALLDLLDTPSPS